MDSSNRDIIEQVLAATDIVEVVGAHLELKPAGGGRYKALCPFHHEKTPSFIVTRDRGTFHCFGCGKGGDAIAFLREHGGLDFKNALQHLADRAGIRLPEHRGGPGDDDLRSKLLEFGKFAGKFYRGTLGSPVKGETGRAYLKTRELKDETVERFGLGYAPPDWRALTDYAHKAGYPERVMESSGLARRGERGQLYDFFRERLMFPIKDATGNVVAFGGRALDGNPAKYINSPENPVYKKGRTLYGLYEAREGLRRAQRALLVEGYFDLLRCFDAGLPNVLATCGTALTSEQAEIIRRYVPEVLVVYDGDRAGIQASLRSIGVLTGAGLQVKALALPDGQDPDDYIQQYGAEAFVALAENALDFVTFYVRMNHERVQHIEGRTEVAREVFGILRDVGDGLRREEYVKHLAEQLRLNKERCLADFYRFAGAAEVRTPAPARRDAAERPAYCREDVEFLAILMEHSELRERARKAVQGMRLGEGALETALRAVLEEAGPGRLYSMEDEGGRRLFSAAANLAPPAGVEAELRVDKRLKRLLSDALLLESAQLDTEIRQAERSNDAAQLMELLRRKREIHRERERVGAP